MNRQPSRKPRPKAAQAPLSAGAAFFVMLFVCQAFGQVARHRRYNAEHPQLPNRPKNPSDRERKQLAALQAAVVRPKLFSTLTCQSRAKIRCRALLEWAHVKYAAGGPTEDDLAEVVPGICGEGLLCAPCQAAALGEAKMRWYRRVADGSSLPPRARGARRAALVGAKPPVQYKMMNAGTAQAVMVKAKGPPPPPISANWRLLSSCVRFLGKVSGPLLVNRRIRAAQRKRTAAHRLRHSFFRGSTLMHFSEEVDDTYGGQETFCKDACADALQARRCIPILVWLQQVCKKLAEDAAPMGFVLAACDRGMLCQPCQVAAMAEAKRRQRISNLTVRQRAGASAPASPLGRTQRVRRVAVATLCDDTPDDPRAVPIFRSTTTVLSPKSIVKPKKAFGADDTIVNDTDRI
jgi:hypothetical protein